MKKHPHNRPKPGQVETPACAVDPLAPLNDPLGSYTGVPFRGEEPTQDADDL